MEHSDNSYEFASSQDRDMVWNLLSEQINRVCKDEDDDDDDDDAAGNQRRRQHVFRNPANTVLWTSRMLSVVKKIEWIENPRSIRFSFLRPQKEKKMAGVSCDFSGVEDQDAAWTAVVQALDQIQRDQYAARMAARYAPPENAGEGARAIGKKYKSPTQL